MDWTEDYSLTRRILDSLRSNQSEYQEHIPHMTELIYCLTKSWRKRFSPLPDSDEEVKIFALGIWLERVMFGKQRDTQVSGQLEGIWYSTDFMHNSLGEDLYGEAKTTRISTNNFPYRTDKKTGTVTSGMPDGWKRQLLGYMKTLGVTQMAYAVWFLMGNYANPMPEFKTYRVSASQAEIDENWTWLQERKEVYMMHVDANRMPTPFIYNEPWECEHCVYKLSCEMDSLERAEDAKERERQAQTVL